MDMQRQNEDGSWSTAKPIPPSRQLRVENWLRRNKLSWLARLLAKWDERRLGR